MAVLATLGCCWALKGVDMGRPVAGCMLSQ